MNGKAVVMVSDERIEVFLKGGLLVSYPRRLWEISERDGDQVLWFSRERTRSEFEKLFLTLRQVIRKRGGSGMEVRVIQSSGEEDSEEPELDRAA